MVWQKAALPVSRYIVLKTTTRSMPQSQAGYNNAILSAWGAVIYVSIELPIWRSINLWSEACLLRYVYCIGMFAPFLYGAT